MHTGHFFRRGDLGDFGAESQPHKIPLLTTLYHDFPHALGTVGTRSVWVGKSGQHRNPCKPTLGGSSGLQRGFQMGLFSVVYPSHGQPDTIILLYYVLGGNKTMAWPMIGFSEYPWEWTTFPWFPGLYLVYLSLLYSLVESL